MYTRDHETGARRELPLRVKGFARYELEQGNDTARSVGLGVGVGGLVSNFGLLSVRLDAEDAHQLGEVLNRALTRAGARPLTPEQIAELSPTTEEIYQSASLALEIVPPLS